MRIIQLCTASVIVCVPVLAAADPESQKDFTVLCEALDPELDQGHRVMTWQDTSVVPNRAMAVRVPITTGIPVGTTYVVGTDVSDYILTQAGPKFANGIDGTYIAYTKGISGLRHIAHFKLVPPPDCSNPDPAGCFIEGGTIIPPANQIYSTVYTTEEETLDFGNAMVVYRWTSLTGSPPPELRWRGVAGTPAEDSLPDPTAPFGRIQSIKDADHNDHLFMAATVTKPDDGDGEDDQVVIVDATDPTAQPITITSEDGKHWNPFIWFDHVRDKNMMVVRYEPPLGGQRDIKVLQQQTLGDLNSWVTVRTYTSADIGEPPTMPYLLSPEAFMWKGKSYLLFSSSNDPGAFEQEDANIWVVEVKGSGSFFFDRVNDRPPGFEARPRFEAEVFFKQGAAVIFYNYKRIVGSDPGLCAYMDGLPQTAPQFTVRRALPDLP